VTGHLEHKITKAGSHGGDAQGDIRIPATTRCAFALH
jgi:hypothetical protein